MLRKQRGLRQAEMQARIGVSGATWSNYELGGTEPDIETLLKIAKFFNITVSALIQENIEKAIVEGKLIPKTGSGNFQGNSKLIGKGTGKLIAKKGQKTEDLPVFIGSDREYYKMPQVVTVDTAGNENVVLVPVRARAGYLNGYADPEFVEKLPAYRLPGLNNGTFRLFEVEGLSMYPTLYGGDIIIGQNVDQLRSVRDDRVHVVITKHDGVVVKRVLNRLEKDGKLILKSDNYKDRDMYPPIVLGPEEIIEIWYATGYISRQMRPPADMYNRLIDLEGRLNLLEDINRKKPQ